jgi:hypothetical protein
LEGVEDGMSCIGSSHIPFIGFPTIALSEIIEEDVNDK